MLMTTAADIEFQNAPAETQALTLKGLYLLVASHEPALQQVREANGYGLFVCLAEGRATNAEDDDVTATVFAEVGDEKKDSSARGLEFSPSRS